MLTWCQDRRITFTRSRPGSKNNGCHVEQKNWAVVRTVVGYYRYDTVSELLLLNEIWRLQSQLTNYFHPNRNWYPKSEKAPRCPVNTTRPPPRFTVRPTTRA